MACPKRCGERIFGGVRFTLYIHDIPSLEMAKEKVKKYDWPKERVRIVKRYRARYLPTWDIYFHEIEVE